MNSTKLAQLQTSIGYQFNDQDLLLLALTHRSAAKQHNERLEFLGDSVLGMVIADTLFAKFPEEPEGTLTRMRASLVNRTTLAKIARELALGELIILGSGELKSGGRRRDSILSDTVEAIIGAIFLDAGFFEAQKSITNLFKQRVEKLDPSAQIKDSKTQLQEFLQSRKIALPEYKVIEVSGMDHAQTFEVSCEIEGADIVTTATGKSRRIAEQKAAEAALEKLVK
ncbi:ribonuclease III [Glaciecola sp. 1036]|uniref:ribonuclease III n=1 Tax=Alteromonadaceae TaxID=72275 RepID=UPI003D047BF1